MPDPHIRPAIDGDLTSLIHAFDQADYFCDRLTRQARGRGALLVARLGGHVAGNVYLWWEPAEEPELRARLPGVPLLTHLEVHPAHRNRGIGTALIAEAERMLRKRGHRSVALGVGVKNAGAQRLYARLDYVEWRYEPVRTPDEIYQIYVKPLATRSRAGLRCGTPDPG